jgi:carbamoyltransferase
MNILGISCFYHDAAAALVSNGRLVAACSEERFTRIKHDPELPEQAVAYCIEKAGIAMSDIDYVAFYDKPLLKFERILSGYMAEPFRAFRAAFQAFPIWLNRKLWTYHVIHKELGFDKEVLFLPHHLSHAAGTFFGSPFDRSAILTVDGVGEWATASFGTGFDNRVKLLAEMTYPHSVGLLYSAFTYFLGFHVNSAEYKVMGLAPYGKPVFTDLIEDKLVRIHDDGSIHLNMKYFTFHRGLTMTGRRFEKLFGKERRTPEAQLNQFHNDVAASIQAVTEKIVVRMGRHVREVTGEDKLCMSGGVALNCKANGVLLREGVFDEIYVQPAAGDSGGAVGAALYAYHRITGEAKQSQPFFGLGPSYTSESVKQFLEANDIPFEDLTPGETASVVAQKIADGAIVGVYQGAMEFGPRALGFRSILADPRDNKMKEKINAAVKYREAFRPFAPAVLAEDASDYFDTSVASPYMLFNFEVRPDKRSVIPAVTHVDASSRIQTVSRGDNPLLYDIISEFKRLTGVAVVLNTSFNLRGHPIVNRPEEAFATFCSGGIDILLFERYIVNKLELPDSLRERFTVGKQLD